MQLPKLNFIEIFDFDIKKDKDTFFIYDLVVFGMRICIDITDIELEKLYFSW